MKFRITRTSVLLVAGVAAALMLGSCAAPAPAVVTPSTPAPPAVAQPVIRDIAGALEWHPNEENVLICACSDPDGNPLTYYWTAEKGIIKGEGQRVSWTPPEELGEYEIVVRVTNDKGGEATSSKKFAVVAPPPPPEDKTVYLKLTPPSATVATATGRVRSFFMSEIQCEIPGRDLSEFTYTWTANGGKLTAEGLDEGKASRVGWLAPGANGLFIVKVKVTDKAGNWAEGEVTYEVLCCRDP